MRESIFINYKNDYYWQNMAEQNKYKRLGINTIFTFIGNVGPQFISFLLVPFYTYWLTKEDYGIQDMILTYMVFVVPYLALGLYEAVFIFPKDKPIEEQRKFFTTAVNTITASILVFLTIWIITPQCIHDLLLPGRMRDYELFLILAIVSGPYQRVMQNFARSLDKMRVYSITGVVYALLVLILSLTVVPYYGLAGFFIAFLSAQILSTIYTFCGIKGWRYYSLVVSDKKILSSMLKYSIPLVPNATMWWVVNSINRPIMLSTVGLEEMGLYAVAHRFPSIISTLFTVFFSALQISVIEEYGKKNYSTFYNNVFRVILVMLISVMFFFMLLGDIMFDILVDDKFHSAVCYLPVLSVGAILSSISAYVGSTFTVLKKTMFFLYSSILAAVVAVIANLLLIPKYGVMGACVAICLSQLAMFLYRWYKSYKYVNFEKGVKLSLMIICSMAALLAYYYIDNSIWRVITIFILFIAFLMMNFDLSESVKTMMSRRKFRQFS